MRYLAPLIALAGFLIAAPVASAQTKLALGHSTAVTDPCHQSALIFAKEWRTCPREGGGGLTSSATSW
jgi:TRAP-type C4-dicarboxylate transport system substrate-binding protein